MLFTLFGHVFAAAKPEELNLSAGVCARKTLKLYLIECK